jgi:hypothetical protein
VGIARKKFIRIMMFDAETTIIPMNGTYPNLASGGPMTDGRRSYSHDPIPPK